MIRSIFAHNSISHTLLVGDAGIALHAEKKGVPSVDMFAAQGDVVAEQKILENLSHVAKNDIRIFDDTSGQNFERHALPPLNILDRPKLLQRRLTQKFPDAMATAYRLVGRGEVIMASLSSTTVLGWIERLKNSLPVTGLLSIECADMALRLMPEATRGWLMMLFMTRTGGLRQIVLRDGAIIFSRLTSDFAGDGLDDLVSALDRDLQASFSYLMRHGLKDSHDVRVLMLLPDDMANAVTDLALPVHSVTLLAPMRAAARLGLETQSRNNDVYVDAIVSAWVAGKRKLDMPLLPPVIKAARQVEQLRFYGMRGAVVALLVAFALNLWQGVELTARVIDNHRQKDRLVALRQQAQQEETAMASVIAPLGKLRAAVERQRVFSEAVIMPWPSLIELQRGLGDKARVVRLDWQTGESIKGKPAPENMLVDLRLAENIGVSPDNKAMMGSFKQIAQHIIEGMPDFAVDVVHYPLAALPQDTLAKISAPILAPNNIPVTELSLKRVHP